MQCRPPEANLVVLLQIIVVFTLGIALFAQGASALSPDGYIFFQNNTNNIGGDTYSNLDLTVGNESLQDVGGIPLFIEAQWSRHRNQSFVVTQDSSSDINYVIYNMTNRAVNLTGEVTASAGIVSSRSVDIAYTSVNGSAIMVWDSSTADTTVNYTLWNGTDFTANSTIQLVTASTTRRFIRLVSDPNSDYVMLIYNDALSDIGAVLWNGTAWVNATNITSDGAAATYRRPMDFAWYPNGSGIIFYPNATGGTIDYREFYRSTGNWSENNVAYALTATVQALDVCANPNNNYVGVITTDSLGDANLWMWNGTNAETNPANPSEDGAIETAGHNTKCEWEKSGTQALFVWVDANANALHLSYAHYNLSADLATRQWSTNNIATGFAQITADIAADDIENVKLRANPYNNSIMISFKDLLLATSFMVWDEVNISPASANYRVASSSNTANAPSYEYIWNRYPSDKPIITSGVNDSSNTSSPTNESSNVTFRANATDPNGDQWKLLVCTGLGELNGACSTGTYCFSDLVNNGSIASCQYNTTGLTNQNYTWYAYVCDNSSACTQMDAFNNATIPFEVNHKPTADANLSTLVPNVTTQNITCIALSADADIGDSATSTYAWYIKNESQGSFTAIAGQNWSYLNNTYYDSNDQVFCQVIPVDNHGFLGNEKNTSVATVQNGTLHAYSYATSTSFEVFGNTTLNASCSITQGDGENVTLILQDNSTGVFAQSTTTPGAFYVNQSSINIGRLANTSTANFTFTIFAQSKGVFQLRAQCQASDTNVTLANSTEENITIVPYNIEAINPANDTLLDRDETNATVSDNTLLQVQVPSAIPDLTAITFYANLTNPSGTNQTYLSLGSAVTSSGIATLFYNPIGSSRFAGNYTWWGESAAGAPNVTKTIIIIGQTVTNYSDIANYPATTYFQNESMQLLANLTTLGIESAQNMSDMYSALVSAAIMSPNGTNDSATLSFTDPYWNASYSFLTIGGVGNWNVYIRSSDEQFFDSQNENRTITVYGFMNVTDYSTTPSSISVYGQATTTCHVQDQHTHISLNGMNVTYYRNGTFLGSNLTNSSGESTFTYQYNTTGTWTITCNVTDELSQFYYAGDAPEQNSSLTVNPFGIQAISPANNSIVDRDSANTTDLDIILLNATVPAGVPDGLTIEFRANLTDPIIGGQTDLLLGSNTTLGGSVALNFNPSSTFYAGTYEWWANYTAGVSNASQTFIIKGALSAQYADSTNPNSAYFINDSGISIDINVTSAGPETRNQINDTYLVGTNSTIANVSGTTDTLALIYGNPLWSVTHTIAPLQGAGNWNSSVIAGGTYWYPSSTTRLFSMYSFMNVTSNSTTPASINAFDFATTTCTLQEVATNAPAVGVSVDYYRNGTYLGNATTNASGQSELIYQVNVSGNWTITCNVTDQPSAYYYRGTQSEGNSSLEVIALLSTPPQFSGIVSDTSNSTNPLTVNQNETFSANATDPEGDQWYLLICDSPGVGGGACSGTTICQSGLVNNGSIASCQHNTTIDSSFSNPWWAYPCDNNTVCGNADNTTTPYNVNHYPTIDGINITPITPTVTDTLNCNVFVSDSDAGDSASVSYVWYIQNESAGGFSAISGETNATLANTFFDSNDQIICEATPIDTFLLTGNPINSTMVVVQNGTLSANSNIASTSIIIGQTTSLNVSCTVSNGDSESVTLIVQDNRTGIYTQSSVAVDDIYVSQSSFGLGRIASTTSQQTITVYNNQIGNYSIRAECQTTDTNVTTADSTPQTLQVSPDTVPPVISGINSDPGSTSAVITWNTDKSSDSTVDYGFTTSLGNSTNDASIVTSHSISLTGLSNASDYYFNVTSCRPGGYCTTEGPYTFSTTSIDSVSPVESGYCTGIVIEPGPNYREGYLSKGDVFKFYCELPSRVRANEKYKIKIENKNKQKEQTITNPDIITGTQVAVYP